jgi:hypothetical protein
MNRVKIIATFPCGEGLTKTMKTLTQDRMCPYGDSNWPAPLLKSSASSIDELFG